MASLRAQGLQSFGVASRVIGATNDVLYAQWDAVKGTKPPTVGGKAQQAGRVDLHGTSTFMHFPLMESSIGNRNATGSQLFDVICEYDGVLDLGSIKANIGNNNYAALPSPLCPKIADCAMGYTMNIAIEQIGNNKYHIIKQFLFIDTRQKIRPAIEQLVHGLPFEIQRAPDTWSTTNILFSLFNFST